MLVYDQSHVHAMEDAVAAFVSEIEERLMALPLYRVYPNSGPHEGDGRWAHLRADVKQMLGEAAE